MYDVNVLKNCGININKCLEILGNIDLYNETIKDFMDTVSNKINNMTSNLEEGKLNEYSIDLLSLKSDARYLGFDEISRVIADIEPFTIKKDIESVKKEHPNLVTQVNAYVGVARLYLGVGTPQDVEASSILVQNGATISTENVIQSNSNIGIQPVAPAAPVSVVPQTSAPVVKIDFSGGGGIRPIIKPKLMKDKILIVDDSPMIIKFVQKFLSEDYEVISANDGEKAINLLDDPNFRKDLKLCLLDLNMPRVDGYQVLQHCKELDYYKDLPIAVESGVEDTASLDRVNSYPIVGILLKPFKEADLRRVVEKSYATYF